MTFITAPRFTAAEIEGAKKIRNLLKVSIPAEFDTDFYLARWWRGYDGNLDLIEKRMKELFEHRKLLGYDRLNKEELEVKIDIARKTFARFSLSPISSRPFSGNVCIQLQKMCGTDFKEIFKALPLSYILHSYYILQESFTRSILEKEAETGAPAAAVSILDLEGLSISEFINPFSGPTRMARLVVKIWADYFKEGLIKLVMLNPPTILSIIWQVAKLIMDKKMLSRIIILENPSDLLNYFHPEAVPESYGGQWRDDSGRAKPPESVCNPVLRVIPQHYFDIEKLWRDHGFITAPDTISTNLKGKQMFEVTKKCEKNGQELLWQFTANSDIEFDVIRSDGDKDVTVWPKITLTTVKIPEQGFIVCKKGDYILRFINPNNSWTPIKLHYSIEMTPM